MPDVYDILIVGAGPAGIAASLRAIQHKMKYITLERDEIGGTVAKYPRQKLVMTSPVEFPMYGKFKKTELSKENLLAFWDKVLHRADFKVRTGQKVEDIKRGRRRWNFHRHHAGHAIPRSCGGAGSWAARALRENSASRAKIFPKVMYRLIEADHYINKKILVIGGGDSAVEAAMGLAHQVGNKVTLSYRQRDVQPHQGTQRNRVADAIKSGKVEVLFNSNPVEFKETVRHP